MAKFEIETEYETVNLLRSGAAAKIELNRPDSLNAWNGQMSADLFAAYEAVRDDDEEHSAGSLCLIDRGEIGARSLDFDTSGIKETGHSSWFE